MGLDATSVDAEWFLPADSRSTGPHGGADDCILPGRNVCAATQAPVTEMAR